MSSITISNLYESKWVKIFAAGSLAFIGYAVYFDRQRRLDPLYKEKIRQNRKAKQAVSNATSINIEFPDPRNPHATEQFFFQQISIGEERLMSGETTEGIFHLSNAVVTCAQPAELLQIFQQTIAPNHFEMLRSAIPQARDRMRASLQNLMQASGPRVEEVKTPDGSEQGDDKAEEENKKIFLLDEELE